MKISLLKIWSFAKSVVLIDFVKISASLEVYLPFSLDFLHQKLVFSLFL
jgi:hypothetical protein